MDERKSDKVFSAFPRNDQTVTPHAFTKLEELGIDVAKPNPSFNAGLVVINLDSWRRQNISDQVQVINKYNGVYRLWDGYGSQPPLLILFGGDRFEQLDSELFLNNIAYRKNIEKEQLCRAMFLHWNGDKKPWENCDGKNNCHNWDIWNAYNGSERRKYSPCV
jgi:lipopolysaccharide biosynthesis glycosyltransferase